MLNYKSTKQKTLRGRAQAMVEFAIALPVLMLILVGIFEAGRMLFIYAAVQTAAREASRYASAVGYNDAGSTAVKYNDCVGIKGVAQRTVFFTTPTITITHDTGPGDPSPVPYCGGSMTADAITLESGDRVNVTVSALYGPMIRLIPFPTRTFTASSARTILGIYELDLVTSTVTSVGGGPGPIATATVTKTGVPGPSSTATQTSTVTSTPEFVFTLTSGPTPTITLLPSSTATFTETSTPTITPSPTATSTPVPGCGSLSAGSLSLSGNLLFMTITNPHDAITLASVQLVWNAATGGPSGKPLIWQTTTIANQTWTVADGTGNYTSTPASTITIPGNNRTSTIIIAFDKPYNNAPTNGTSITLNFSTVDCSSITRTR